MVKVLIVDDDRLARQGLILSIQWEKYGMKIVGEAPNGLKALQFLEANSVDLVLTDLAMPVMSGIELMKLARKKFRQVQFAVLTFHEDFHSTQEALRLGAIDYISKLQLEKENLDTVLARIQDRFAGKGSTISQERPRGDRAMVFLQVQTETSVPELIETLGGDEGAASEIAEGLVLWYDGPQDVSRPPSGWFLLRLQGLLGESVAKIAHLLRQYQSRTLFYDFVPESPTLDLTFEQLEIEAATVRSDDDANELRNHLLAMEWIHGDDAFDQLARELRSARLPYPALLRLLVSLEREWASVHEKWSGCHLEMPEVFRSWTDVVRWLSDVRDFASSAPALADHSPEAKAGTFRALQILHAEFDRPLHTADVATRVHMSRSHFCLCFRQIVGESFLDCLSGLRLAKAKEFLQKTDLPIYEIAEKCGYSDERYFGRLFKKSEGLLPRDFRRHKTETIV